MRSKGLLDAPKPSADEILKEQAAREQAAREQAREQAAREHAAKEQAKEQAAREQEAREKLVREQAAKEAREIAAREIAAREIAAREAAAAAAAAVAAAAPDHSHHIASAVDSIKEIASQMQHQADAHAAPDAQTSAELAQLRKSVLDMSIKMTEMSKDEEALKKKVCCLCLFVCLFPLSSSTFLTFFPTLFPSLCFLPAARREAQQAPRNRRAAAGGLGA